MAFLVSNEIMKEGMLEGRKWFIFDVLSAFVVGIQFLMIVVMVPSRCDESLNGRGGYWNECSSE